ncbi:(2Fe-2S)-binding protein [Alkaliphilus oremlandii]|uniref:(2Fe-2S)-binding domain protein n=1 Tax=Alkaliphilus oremlandii (strain OhILAs) TaxID=350688 RepID=A8MEU6_ALKOO|nr:(2Fe-2S)-binding protein [Alkaliphilus oremlandii]ABW18425.1 (2Fe-2S)-binding domain protein [Alkaliphilus oremlandii OhILAs]
MCEKHNKGNCFEYVNSGKPAVEINCVVNGEQIHAMVDPTMTLLNFLNKELKLFGTKEGCGEGECGACTIIMNGKTVNSCLVLAVEADDTDILTVEGLGEGNKISILQEEFIEHDALQCGFCTPGMLMSARELLNRQPNPSEEEIKEALAGNFCRCTGYTPIIAAVQSAAKREREGLK